MEEFMSENNSGAFVPQQDNRGNENKEKRQRFDPSRQDGRRNNYNRNNRRRRNNGPRQGGYDNKKIENAEGQAEAKVQNKERSQERQNNREKGNNNKQFNKPQGQTQNQGQGQDKRNQQFSGERKPKNKRSRELDAEVAKNVKKVETIEDIRSDNARITKEIYLEIASLKNINLN